MKSFEEIKQAVAAGKTVYWKQSNYVVRGDCVVCTNNDHAVGLMHADGVGSEYDPADFFVKTARFVVQIVERITETRTYEIDADSPKEAAQQASHRWLDAGDGGEHGTECYIHDRDYEVHDTKIDRHYGFDSSSEIELDSIA